jgi:hypothetical protein
MNTTRMPANGVPGSMSGMPKPPVATWTFHEPGGGRFMRVEDYGPGRVWVQDLGHPTGFGWWAERVSIPKG